MKKQYHQANKAQEQYLDKTAGHGTAERAGNAADRRRQQYGYQSLAHNRKEPVEHPDELKAEQDAYRARFAQRPRTQYTARLTAFTSPDTSGSDLNNAQT